MDFDLIQAVKRNQVEEVGEILLLRQERLHINAQDGFGWTVLHNACYRGHHLVVGLLLAHPDVEVNLKNVEGDTPFMLACYCGWRDVVSIMVSDGRVSLGEPDGDGVTPLRWVSTRNHVDVARQMIASGRRLDFAVDGDPKTDPLLVEKRLKVHRLLSRYQKDPYKTTFEVRMELRMCGDYVADVFAQVVLLCDGYLALRKQGRSAKTEKGRFFNILRQLPMDVQMVLCHRCYASARTNVSAVEFEAALTRLAPIMG